MKYRIIDIREQVHNKNRVSLYCEEGFLLSLSYDTLLRHNLACDKEIDEDLLKQLRQEDTVKYAKEISLRYIAYSSRTRRQVEAHLQKKGIDRESVTAAVSSLEKYGYIDDAAYVEEFTRSYGGKLGKDAIRHKLLERGVTQKVIEENLAVTPESQTEAAIDITRKLSQRYKNLCGQKKRQKIYAALLRRGFDHDTIMEAFGGDEEEHE